MIIVDWVMNFCERGWLPDWLIRWGIRQLLKSSLDSEITANVAQKNARFRQFMNALDEQPTYIHEDQRESWKARQLPVEFFQKILGAHLKFSACFWPVGVHELDSAESEALALICDRSELEDGMTVLDFGAGWGSLSLWIAERYPNCAVTAISANEYNRSFIQGQAMKLGLSNITALVDGMENFETSERFDRIFAIESLMHAVNYRLILSNLSSWLTDEGKLFVELFCHRERAYFLGEDSPRNWMGRYFMIAGIMPSDSLMLYFQQQLVLEEHWSLNGLHYQQTADYWLENLTSARDEIIPVLEGRYGREAREWYHKWRLFLLTMSEMFSTREGNEWWVSQYLLTKRPGGATDR